MMRRRRRMKTRTTMMMMMMMATVLSYKVRGVILLYKNIKKKLSFTH